MLQLVEKYKVTLLTVVPQQVASLLKTPTLSKQRLASIRFVSVGGGSCYVANLLKLQDFLITGQISYGYALRKGHSPSQGLSRLSFHS